MVTPTQHKIYQFIQQFMQEQGFAPSLQEIAQGIGISPRSKSLISRYVHALESEGLLKLGDKGYRNIQLTHSHQLTLPMVGRIAAGAPLEAIAQSEVLDLGALLLGKDHYVLEVKGDSMIEEGILDGDKVICKRQSTANEGDIVVALVDNLSATLKRIRYKSEEEIVLLPANSKLKPQIYAASRVQIQGIFIGLLRLYK